MTRRQIYFRTKNPERYYVSEEFYGDKEELERFRSLDRCDKTWCEIMDILNEVHTLLQFVRAIASIGRSYHSPTAGAYIGTRITPRESKSEINVSDETYGIIEGMDGCFFDEELSMCRRW